MNATIKGELNAENNMAEDNVKWKYIFNKV